MTSPTSTNGSTNWRAMRHAGCSVGGRPSALAGSPCLRRRADHAGGHLRSATDATRRHLEIPTLLPTLSNTSTTTSVITTSRLKKTYSTMGKIRDRQLCLKRIKQNERADDGRFRNEVHSLEKKIKELEEKRSGFLTKNEFEAIEEDIIKVLPIASADVLVSGFFQQKLNVINKIASKSELSDQELHNVRKAIKDIIYITRIYRDDLNMPLPFPFWNEAELEMAESFSHKLGLFNDTCISLSFLASPEINKTKMPAHEHLQVMRRRWLSEKRKLKKRILELYNSSYKKYYIR